MKPRTEVYVSHYLSPLGNMLMIADENGSRGLWCEIQKNCVNAVDASCILAEEPFEETKRWLDAYFEGLQPDFTPKFQLDVTPLEEYVYNEIIKLPYGKTATYTEIADRVTKNNNFKTKPQSVESAIGKNPSLVIPCHRIVDEMGFLNGYTGGGSKIRSSCFKWKESIFQTFLYS